MELERFQEANQIELAREANSIEAQRRRASLKILDHASKLIDELMIIIHSEDVDARIKLQAIGMLLDRSVPKVAAQNVTPVVEEVDTPKKGLRDEVEAMIRKQLGAGGGE